ncbi:hypothetical protein AN396_00710 [Candidatus Epulonipiscium fishelsonii]|uniref:Uncharacterized protein n=1 Tax=Candidatus Epulonipiscium fishelsonii TaxID=77094 RepID=A0ACC8XDL8_9FIRM|nr:hypothetical protein AN396_00710 [Epulopiscium sp. SCG-B11WGA-EpuloA1]
MKWHTINYLFGEGFKGFWRNRMMAVASIATIMLCLIILGISYSIVKNVEYIMVQIEQQMGITVYISDEYTPENIKQIYTQIQEIPNVIDVEYITPDDALRSFAGSDLALYDKFKNDNPLPASFEIEVNRIENQAQVVSVLKEVPGLEVRFLKSETETFFQLNQSIQIFSGVIIVALIGIALLLITNTIKLTVYVRKKEIGIMKYIGATDAFIRIPFLIEGLSIGILGGMIPIFVVYNLYACAEKMLTPNLSQIFSGIQLITSMSIITELIPLFMGIGVTISAVGSILAIHKYLKV